MPINDDAPWPWHRVLLVGSAIALGVLFGGGIALRALNALRDQGPPDLGWAWFLWLLLVFSAGGGLTIGLLILAWWLAVKRGFSWTLGFVVVVAVLFAMFVWPSPYRYDTVKDGECRRVRVQRWTGEAECIVWAKGQEREASQSSSASR